MNTEMNEQAANHAENPRIMHNEPGMPTEPRLAHVWYCRKCRDVTLGIICPKCGKEAVRTEGTPEQYRQVAQAVMDHRSEWHEMLESMTEE